MTAIKFCGLTRHEDALAASRLGASFAGVIFADDSRRRVTPDTARRIFDGMPSAVSRVGVFRNVGVQPIAGVANDLGLDVVQIHAAADAAFVGRLRDVFGGKIWLVAGIDQAVRQLDQQFHDATELADAVLLDTSQGGASGGTGATFDWVSVATEVRTAGTTVPVIVAGGLTPANVGEAIQLFDPFAVDISSGVELSPGIKDHNLMRSFAEAVSSAS